MAPGMVPRMKISQPDYRTVTAATDFKILLPAVTVRGWELLETKSKGQLNINVAVPRINYSKESFCPDYSTDRRHQKNH